MDNIMAKYFTKLTWGATCDMVPAAGSTSAASTSATNAQIKSQFKYLSDFNLLKNVPGLKETLAKLDFNTILLVRKYLKTFADFYKKQGVEGNFDGCSLGNLIFAGVFIDKGYDFNKTLDEIMNVFSSKINASLCNISKGENRFLCGLKDDGQFLNDEALMVEVQSRARMKGIYLLECQPDTGLIEKVKSLEVDEAHAFLSNLHKPPKISKKDTLTFGYKRF